MYSKMDISSSLYGETKLCMLYSIFDRCKHPFLNDIYVHL
jgi:hypothetical protein